VFAELSIAYLGQHLCSCSARSNRTYSIGMFEKNQATGHKTETSSCQSYDTAVVNVATKRLHEPEGKEGVWGGWKGESMPRPTD
jgi:hypothetical protein